MDDGHLTYYSGIESKSETTFIREFVVPQGTQTGSVLFILKMKINVKRTF